MLRVPCPWLVSMRDVMVDLKRPCAVVVRDIMIKYDTINYDTVLCDFIHGRGSACLDILRGIDHGVS